MSSSMSEITYLPLDWGQHFNRLLWGSLRSILYFILQTSQISNIHDICNSN